MARKSIFEHDEPLIVERNIYIIPTVTCFIEPKIKIYDPKGGYFYREIGFNKKFNEE